MSQITQLEPRVLWDYFAKLSEIPRCSKKETAAAAWIESVGRSHGAQVKTDAVGNVLLCVPASPGHEQAPTVILQGHIDMVCEKNSDVTHDFDRDPIRLSIAGEFVTAEGTTLGADNGIGVAAALALLDADSVHGPLELLFTVDEETGLTGANAIQAGFLSGGYMLNLDSEEPGQFTIGSAGGQDTTLVYKAPRTAADGWEVYNLAVTGLHGGHSGMDIHLGRGNSIKILARLLLAACEDGGAGELRIGDAQGGSKRNAIPREARATVAVPAGQGDALRDVVDAAAGRIGKQFEGVEEELTATLKPAQGGTFCSADDSLRLIRLLAALPHGVLAMSTAIDGLVETSSNAGVLRDLGDGYEITTSTRSSVGEALQAVLAQIRSVGHLAGCGVRHSDGYPGWKPKLGTPLLQAVERAYVDLFGEKPAFQAIHAGLECGLFLGKYPQLQVASFGPDIQEAHSPNERVNIESVQKFWDFTKALLAELTKL